jgi:putative ABC transport system permease protein
MLLRAVAGAFSGGVTVAGADRLVVYPRYSIIDILPISQASRILSVEGVEAVTHQTWFGGFYQEPQNFFAKFPVEPSAYFEMFRELLIAPDQLDAFVRIRRGAVVSQSLADRYEWRVGDIIPIQADIFPMLDGTRLWEFELVGTFTVEDGDQPQMLFSREYFDESVAPHGRDRIGWWTVRLSNLDQAAEIATAIDTLFENSMDPTRTATENEFGRQFANQLGDMGFITTVIMSAVFFTIVLLTANTMTQALRERIPELAAMKTLGFSDARVSLLVLGEAVLLCVVGSALGIGAAYALLSIVGPTLESFIGVFEYSRQTLTLAVGMSLLIGLAIGSFPALRASRLGITDALREC